MVAPATVRATQHGTSGHLAASKRDSLPQGREARVKLVPVGLILLALLGCSGGESNPGAPAANTSPAGGSATVADQPQRDALIYAAVVRRLVTKDHTFGGGDPGFKVVYIVDGAVEGAEDSMKTLDELAPKQAFGHDLKDGVAFLSAAAELPPVEFVPDRDAAIVGADSGGPGHVKNEGVLITLGPIEGHGTRVEVGNSLWINGLAGQWLTYVLELEDGVWRVTGTTGPMAIS